MTRKIVFNLAVSLDGYIAREDGSFDWIKGDGDNANNTENQFNFDEFNQSVDTIVMGKKAYEDIPKETIDEFRNHKIFVASKTKLETKYNNVKFIEGDIVKQILKLKENAGKNIWLFGGANMISPFIQEDVIDEYIIAFIPIILGRGIPLFTKGNPTLTMKLVNSTINDGIVINRYVRRKK